MNPHKEAADLRAELKSIFDFTIIKGMATHERDGTPLSILTMVRRLSHCQYSKGYDSAIELWRCYERGRHHGKDKIHK